MRVGEREKERGKERKGEGEGEKLKAVERGDRDNLGS